MSHTRAGATRAAAFRLAALGSLCLLLAMQAPLLGAARPGNHLSNPGFEQVRGGKVYGWSTPSYWSGAIEPVAEKGAAHGGRRCARLTSALARGKHWGRALTYVRTKIFVGRRLRYSMWAKGKGELLLGYIQYVPPAQRTPHYAYVYQEQPTALTERWQQVTFEFALTDPRTSRIAPIVEIRGEGSVAWLDDGALTSAARPGPTIPTHKNAATAGAHAHNRRPRAQSSIGYLLAATLPE